MIINPYIFGGFDPDAQAFITAAGLTDNTQKTAINQLVLSLKANNIWSKMKAIYPFVGGTASTHKWNLKDPRDLDAAFRLVFNGGWTHSSTGALPNGTNAYADTKLNDNNNLSLNNAHISVYSRTNIDGLYCDIGARAGNNEINIYSKYSNVFYPRIHNTNSGTSNTISSLGYFISNRVISTEVRGYRNNNLSVITNNSSSKCSLNFVISGVRADADSVIQNYSPRQIAFSTIGDGLTDTDATNLYNTVQTFQTSLSRQV